MTMRALLRTLLLVSSSSIVPQGETVRFSSVAVKATHKHQSEKLSGTPLERITASS